MRIIFLEYDAVFYTQKMEAVNPCETSVLVYLSFYELQRVPLELQAV